MRKIKCKIKVKYWKDTVAKCWLVYSKKCWLVYSKKYGITAYGKSKSEAREMFKFTVFDIFLSTKPKHLKKLKRRHI